MIGVAYKSNTVPWHASYYHPKLRTLLKTRPQQTNKCGGVFNSPCARRETGRTSDTSTFPTTHAHARTGIAVEDKPCIPHSPCKRRHHKRRLLSSIPWAPCSSASPDPQARMSRGVTGSCGIIPGGRTYAQPGLGFSLRERWGLLALYGEIRYIRGA